MKKNTVFLLLLICSFYSTAAADVSDLPMLDNFGGSAVGNLAGFNPGSLSDFTLEVSGTAGQEISVAGGLIKYTPAAGGAVRFACKDRTVYIFENKTYIKAVDIDMNAIDYPDIFGAADNATTKTGIYDARNLFLNPGFETKENGAAATSDNFLPKDWTGDNFAVSGGSRARYGISDIAATREGNCNMMTHSGNSLAQPVALQSNTPYKLRFIRWAHNAGNQKGGKWYVGFGAAAKQYEIFQAGFENADGVASYTKYDHEYNFYAGDLNSYAGKVFSVYPYDKNGSANLPLSHYDRMTLVAGSLQAGITGAVSASWRDGTAYAPEVSGGHYMHLDLNNAGVVTCTGLSSSIVTVSGETELHLTGAAPLSNTTIDLQSGDSWLFFDAVKPSAAIEQYLKTKIITINGDSVILRYGDNASGSNQNARIAIYGQGSVIIPYGNASDDDALTVYTQANFGGSSQSYPVYTPQTNLGTFNNAIRSFKLKRGYMVTLANRKDGNGFSKVFIADKNDLEVAVMPKGLEASVSFIRVFRWDWNSQKGWCAGGVEITNATSYYDWSYGGNSTHTDYSYAMIKQKLTWPSWDSFNSKRNVNHLLGLNEPEHPEQHKDDYGEKAIPVSVAIAQYPFMLQSGLRLGSPAPTNFSWLYEFVTECERLNYRLDFVAIHSYWYTSMSSWRSQLTAVWNNAGRPIWVTEWNNGANWTSHNFPNATGPRCDAYGNEVINTSTGVPDTITLPCSPANAAKQMSDIKNIVNIMEEEGTHIERYFLYNWVQDARALVLGDKLTPAGEWYAANPSKIALQSQYDHQWKLVTTAISVAQSAADLTEYTFTWQDYNGETAKGYVFERKAGSAGWVQVGDTIRTANNDESIIVNGAVSIPKITVTDHITATSQYRYRVVGYEGSTASSSVITVTIDAEIPSPAVTAAPLSSSWINLEWNAVDGASSYRIYRAMYPDSVYSVIRDTYKQTSYDDNSGLRPNTIYWYRVHSLNNRGESANTSPVRAITKKIGGADGDGGLTGIADVEAGKGLVLSPNPVKAGEALNLRLDAGEAQAASVEIFDAAGKKISSQAANVPLYAPGSSGIYLVRITAPELIRTIRLLVN
jgi:hypothetical protein